MIIYLAIAALIGAIIALFAIRNNQAKVDKFINDTQSTIDADKAKAKKVIDALKGR
jgi:hypothetical protein